MHTNEEIKANAKLIYAALPDARFSKAAVLALAKCLDERLTWEEIPPEVKVCLMRLAMALDTEDEIERLTAPAVVTPDAVLPPPASSPPPYEPPTITPLGRVSINEVLPGQEAATSGTAVDEATPSS